MVYRSIYSIADKLKGERLSLRREPVSPFLKWLGGKRWLTYLVKDKILNLKHKRYFEPFLGGGAFYFYFRFTPAFLSDINEELINAYAVVRDHHYKLIQRIKLLKTDSDTYYKVRKSQPNSKIERATRFIYLNRTAFSGVYRVNEKGQFNVPFGNYKNPTDKLWKESLIVKASKALKGTNIYSADFETVLNSATSGDLVYCDPIYTTMHNNNGFCQYNKKCFSWADQERLAQACKKARSRGATVLVSNGYHNEIRNLFNGFESITVERKSVICPYSANRKTVQEYLFIGR